MVKHELVGEEKVFTNDSEKLVAGPFKDVHGAD
jgi:hypothetical protein